jgi:nitrate/nitrite transporter NarK
MAEMGWALGRLGCSVTAGIVVVVLGTVVVVGATVTVVVAAAVVVVLSVSAVEHDAASTPKANTHARRLMLTPRSSHHLVGGG